MPRCLHLHKVPRDTGFCAVCGARVLPDWVWLCLCALPLSLMYATAISSRAAKHSVTAPPPVVVTVEVTRIVEETHPVEVIRIITATEPAHTNGYPLAYLDADAPPHPDSFANADRHALSQVSSFVQS
jgi:hypothetical protein